MNIRIESADDRAAIRNVHLSSFPDAQEADLVDRLREDGDTVISLVAVDGGRVLGHLLLSRMKGPFRALGLGPIAVLADRRTEGIGARLINDAIQRAADGGWEGIFLLGDPEYYRRFGFSAEKARDFDSPYAGPNLMALAVNGGDLPVASGRIDYAAAFAALV